MRITEASRASNHFAKGLSKFHLGAVGGILLVATLAVGAKDRVKSITEGSDRYLTHVTTDKPIYRPGEKLYVRGVVLSANGHTPRPAADRQDIARIEIKGPKGEMVAVGSAPVSDSTVGFVLDIPAGAPGGEYTARVSHPSTGDAPAERKFDVRSYRAPRLKSQIVFLRDGYGPGDLVAASLHVDRAEGGAPAGAKVSISARVDGEETWKGETTVDGAGNAGTSFRLPSAIARGEGTLAMTIADGGTVESAVKTIPILLETVDVSIYPEGGDLVAGLVNRVYIEGRTPARKPADMAGFVVNAEGREVGAFRTEHEGRGRFSFVPAKGETYFLRITEPSGIRAMTPLPAVKESGVVITTTSDIVARRSDVVVRVSSSAGGEFRVALNQRGKQLSAKAVTLEAGQPEDVIFTAPKDLASMDGVVVATVFDDQKTPVAERLLFVEPDRRIKTLVTADGTDFVPGDKVTLRVSTTDEAGKPVGAVVGLTVTDSSVLEMIDKREQAPRLPVMVLLESDVKELSDAHVYMDVTNPKAPLATDLLLGTQGWRRFATVDLVRFLTSGGDAARRALALRLPPNAGANGVLPLVGNDPLALIMTLPGYRASPLGHEFDTVGGLPLFMINTVRDGLSVTDGFNPNGIGSNTILNPDMISEIRLILAPVDAEAGRGNGQVQITTKSGTNRFQWNVSAAAITGDSASPLGSSRVLNPGRNSDIPPIFGNSEYKQKAVIREYAHRLSPGWTEGSRSDFTETIYWHAGVKTDARTGKATVSFNLSDAVTAFRIQADAFTKDGALGSAVSEIESVKPFSIEPKIPLQVTSGDTIQLPVGMTNGMNRALRNGSVAPADVAGLTFTFPAENGLTLRPKERARRLVQVDVAGDFSGVANLTLQGSAGPFRDTVRRTLDVQPLGYPYASSTGGIIEVNSSNSFIFTLPDELIPGSISSRVVVYPTPLASMTEALQALIREPYGCFEQTSSTSYPMTMAQQYFLAHSGVDPGLIEKAKSLLEVSYKRLTGFESRSKGYEWFGGDPGHEALTAYGLLQFTDMSSVRSVDKDMLDRTRGWLLSRRDGSGGFKRDDRGHGNGIGSGTTPTTNAYITWALVESGVPGLEREIAAVKALADSTGDSYIVALAANILHVSGDHSGARRLMDKLARAQNESGKVDGALSSITQSGGASLGIETTALSVLAWTREWKEESPYAFNIEEGMRWIVESNKNGRFGSTQSTVLALRAIIAYDAARAPRKAPGRLTLTVDGKPVGAALAFTGENTGAIVLPTFGSELGPGKHTVVLKMEDGFDMPFSMSVKYNSALPDSAEQTQIGIQVALKDPQIQEGGITEAKVSIVNKSDEVISTPVAIVGIPGGLEVRHDQLKELVKAGKIDAYEVIGRDVVLYWRSLEGGVHLDIPLSLLAAVPGSYTGPASRAYLYYTDEYKNWARALKVKITPR